MENLQTCPVCSHTEFETLFACKDYVASGELFTLQRCQRCTLVFTNPRPANHEIAPYYASDRYISHAGDKAGLPFIYKIYDRVRDLSIRSKLRLIKRYHQHGKLMDLGCGLGYFLDGVKRDGVFEAIGADISNEAIAYVQKRFGYTVEHESALKLMPPASFDIITQWHVLEHVHGLTERMQELKRLLKPGGTLFMAVPNSDSWDARHYGPFWDGFDVPRHLYHFNQRSFAELLERNGFELAETLPLWFDAPYISMRSETHRGRNAVFLRGALMGLVSNMAALPKKNFSSLLFVVKARV